MYIVALRKCDKISQLLSLEQNDRGLGAKKATGRQTFFLGKLPLIFFLHLSPILDIVLLIFMKLDE